MMCVKYQVVSKRTGKIIVENFGWFCDWKDAFENLAEIWGRKFEVRIIKAVYK